MSPNFSAPLGTAHFALAAAVDIPQPAAQLPDARISGMPAATLTIKAQVEIPAAERDPLKPHPYPLQRKHGSASPASTDPSKLRTCPLASSLPLVCNTDLIGTV